MRPRTVTPLDLLTAAQRADLARMESQMQRRLEEIKVATTPHERREAGEWILRVAADIYAWSH